MAKPKKKVTRVRRRERKNIERGQAHIQSALKYAGRTLGVVGEKGRSAASSG